MTSTESILLKLTVEPWIRDEENVCEVVKWKEITLSRESWINFTSFFDVDLFVLEYNIDDLSV